MRSMLFCISILILLNTGLAYAGGNAPEYWFNGAIKIDTPVINFKNVMTVGNDSVTITKLNVDTFSATVITAGSLTVSNTTTLNGNSYIGNASSDTLVVTATQQFNAPGVWVNTNGIEAYSAKLTRNNGDIYNVANGDALRLSGSNNFGASIQFVDDNSDTCYLGNASGILHCDSIVFENTVAMNRRVDINGIVYAKNDANFNGTTYINGELYANTGTFSKSVEFDGPVIMTSDFLAQGDPWEVQSNNPIFSGQTLSISNKTTFSDTVYIDDTTTHNGDVWYNNTFWDDMRVPVDATKLGGTKDPGFSVFKTNGAGSQGVFTYFFDAATEEELYFIVQIPHDYKLMTNLGPHVHYCKTTTDTRTVRWGLEYVYANANDTFGTTTIIYTNSTDTGGVAYKSLLTDFSDIDLTTNDDPSMIIVCRIFRDATSLADTYPDDAALFEIDFHYQIDSPGSREEFYK